MIKAKLLATKVWKKFPVFAIAAALLTGAGGFTLATVLKPQMALYPRYSELNYNSGGGNKAVRVTRIISPDYRQPCVEPKGVDGSNLCAAWMAASAADRSALWAGWQLLFSIFGVVGLLISLRYNRQAIALASEANNDNRSNGKKELRAYLDYDGVEFIKSEDDGACLGVKTIIRNYGNTPALNVKFDRNLEIVTHAGRQLMVEPSSVTQLAVAPHDHYTSNMFFFEPIDDELWQNIKSGNFTVHFSVKISYDDVFGEKHDEPIRPLESNGDRPFGIRHQSLL